MSAILQTTSKRTRHSVAFCTPAPSPSLQRSHPSQRPLLCRRPIPQCCQKPLPQKPLSLLTTHLPILPVLVQVARKTWYTLWRIFMSELAPSDEQGNYIRPTSSLTTSPDKEAITDIIRSFNKVDHSYSLFVGLACQWCHRVMLARVLCKREEEVELEYLQPGVDGLWVLQDPANAYGRRLKDVYLGLDKKYKGRFTAPLLVDNATESITSNESADILRILATETAVELMHDVLVWLRPSRDNIYGIDIDVLDALCTRLYETVNDGVYRVGFATSQGAYENALRRLFETLDDVEDMLSRSRFLLSHNVVTEADIRLFPTVFRFDAVYAVLFKATSKSIRADYPAIGAWMRDIYNLPGVSATCDLDATQRNYYSSLFPLNPSAIVPVAPLQDLSSVPERQGLGKPATAP